MITYVVSFVELAPETWLRDTGYMCIVCARHVVIGLSMTAILPFSFDVVRECFFGQTWMNVCVHLHTRAFKHVHGYRYGCRYLHVQCVVEGFSMAAILLFAFQLLFNLIDQISIYWISFEGGSN